MLVEYGVNPNCVMQCYSNIMVDYKNTPTKKQLQCRDELKRRWEINSSKQMIECWLEFLGSLFYLTIYLSIYYLSIYLCLTLPLHIYIHICYMISQGVDHLSKQCCEAFVHCVFNAFNHFLF